MTTLANTSKICAKCRRISSHVVVRSTNAFGSSDLDLRPPEMKRSTMYTWVQECPYCGYVAPDLSKDVVLPEGFLDSEAYRSCENKSFSSALAARFYRLYLIRKAENETESALTAIVRAAWACDDKDDHDNATACRELAAALVPQVIAENPEAEDTYRMIKADLLRRSGHFQELKDEYQNFRFSDDFLQQLLAFELQKAEEQDTACYTVGDATGKV